MNFLRLSCCSNFWHKKCQEVWKTTWSHCRRCRTQIENEEETSASQLESTEAEENPTEVLRSLLNDKQGLEELVSYTPQGYSETMLEYFQFGNTSHFKQKIANYVPICYMVVTFGRSIFFCDLIMIEDSGCTLTTLNNHCYLFVENLEPCYLWSL